MSEQVGLHATLTADVSGFNQAMDSAMARLQALAEKEKALKQQMLAANQAFNSQGATANKNKEKMQKAEQALEKLRKREAVLKTDLKNVTNGVEAQTKSFMQYASATQSATSGTEKIRNTLSTLKGLALGQAGKTLFQSLIGSNAEFEQSVVSFEVLLGSAQKATALMEDLEQFAAVTPLQLEDVQSATELLLAYGVAEEDVMDKLKQLGDLSRGEADKYSRVTLAYGQMVAKQKVTGEELRQMTEAGVPLTAALAQTMHVSTEELAKLIETGKVGIPELNAAVESLTENGGQFEGMMEKQAETMSGLWSTLTDEAKIFAREVGEESFGYLRDALHSVVDAMRTMEENGTLSEIAQELGSAVANAISFVGRFVKLLWEMRDVLTVVAQAIAVYKIAFTGISTVYKSVTGLVTAYNILAGKTVVCTNLETGAVVKLTKAQYKQVTATKATIVAQEGLNNSMKANIFIAIASAVLALIGVLWKWIKTMNDGENAVKELREELDQMSEKFEEIKKSHEEARTEMENTAKATVNEMEAARALIPELETLIKSTNRSAEENEKMQKIVAQLNNAFPDLNLQIDSVTGTLNVQIETLNRAAEAWIRLSKAQATAKYIEDMTGEQAELQVLYDDIYAVVMGSHDEIQRKRTAEKMYAQGLITLTQYNEAMGDPDAFWALDENMRVASGLGFDIGQEISALESYTQHLVEKYQPYTASEETEKTLSAMGFGNHKTTTTASASKATGSPKSNEETERKNKVTAFKNSIKNSEKDIERTHKFGEGYGYITVTDENGNQMQTPYTQAMAYAGITEQADRYRGYADLVLNEEKTPFLTADERTELYREYIQNAEDLDLEAYEFNKDLQEKAFSDRLKDAKNYISKANEFGWENGDTEIAAWQRVLTFVDEAHKAGIVSWEDYVDYVDEATEKIASKARDEMEAQIAAETALLKEKYQTAYDLEKQALEKRLSLIEQNAEAEKQAIQERVDAEIQAIDAQIAARKREKEDLENNLKMERLQAKLAYEQDADNRLALQKEIDKLQAEMDDVLFERATSDRKTAIQDAANAAVAAIDEKLAEAQALSSEALSGLEEKLAENTSGTALAAEIYNDLGIGQLERLAADYGSGMATQVKTALDNALQAVYNGLNSMCGITQKTDYYTTNTANYAPTYNITGVSNLTPSALRKIDEARFKSYNLQRRLS